MIWHVYTVSGAVLLLRGSIGILRTVETYVTTTFSVIDSFTTFGLPSDRTSFTLVPIGVNSVRITRFRLRVNSSGFNGNPVTITIVYYSYSTQVSHSKCMTWNLFVSITTSSHLINNDFDASLRLWRLTLSTTQEHKTSMCQVGSESVNILFSCNDKLIDSIWMANIESCLIPWQNIHIFSRNHWHPGDHLWAVQFTISLSIYVHSRM